MSKKLLTSEIGKIVSKIKKWNPIQSSQEEQFHYIDLGSVDQKEKRIVGAPKINPKEAPSRARQIVYSGDVLVSTVRPNLNGVAYVPKKYNGATASTGFCVLRPKQGYLDSRYLYHWVKTAKFREEMVKFATRASYPAISDRIVKDSEIPFPSLEEQKRIATILDKADAIRRKRQQSIKLADDFLRATFLDMFGDPITNPKGWDVALLKKVASFENGDRSSNYPSGSDIKKEGVLFVSTKNILNNNFCLDETKFITKEKFESLSRGKLKQGDLIITLRGTLGSCCIFESGYKTGFINAQIMIIRPNKKSNAVFLHAFLTSDPIQAILKRIGQGAAVPQLTAKQLSEFMIPFPPIELQKQFANVLSNTKKLQAKMMKNDVVQLFNSLTQRAFRGEL